MKNSTIIIGILILLMSVACNNGPKPIDYGAEGCHFCSMTIVDKQHAAQFVTKKGRTYSFDASECMLNHLKEIDRTTVAQYLVNDYSHPGTFVDATIATYLISNNIPSPMGEYLTAFNSLESASKAKEDNGGELFTWPQLLARFGVTN
ncbi:nitrous oxide reductase accessory protein NosL [Maribacter sp. MMG018]|uniref:nitrous oxide reductase accessory protein NosL n=1 Tax=Maribacter sp. MMG018 TaxID=2822688 RepID=UPI001B3839B8|nr:nitrous oxide reductase accessory protein NosL [Maribacter sp. MMG018]MBQ4913247.1 nitrous oxide reductase accessory protein NosL [Maribacter sp. MMG018]